MLLPRLDTSLVTTWHDDAACRAFSFRHVAIVERGKDMSLTSAGLARATSWRIGYTWNLKIIHDPDHEGGDLFHLFRMLRLIWTLEHQFRDLTALLDQYGTDLAGRIPFAADLSDDGQVFVGSFSNAGGSSSILWQFYAVLPPAAYDPP